MDKPGTHTSVEAVAAAGELLIRAAAAIGRLPAAEQNRLNDATEGKLIGGITWAIEAAAQTAPALRESLRRHPPEGFTGKL